MKDKNVWSIIHVYILSNGIVFMQLVFAFAEATTKIVMYNLFGSKTSRLLNLTGFKGTSFPEKYLGDIFAAAFIAK